MDHLPIPDSCKERAWQVPLLDPFRYDGKGLINYPERVGLTEQQLIEECNSSDELIRRHGFSCVQQWLFFGFLAEVYDMLNANFDLKDFERVEDGVPVVSTAHITQVFSRAYDDIFAEFLRLAAESPAVMAEKNLGHLSSLSLALLVYNLMPYDILPRVAEHRKKLNLVRKTVVTFIVRLENSFEVYGPGYSDMVAPILLSIHCLTETVEVLGTAFLNDDQIYLRLDAAKKSQWRILAFYETKLINNGWCLNRAGGIMKESFHFSMTYIASLLPSFDNRDHSTCKQHRCQLSEDRSLVYPKHDKSSCSGKCRSFKVDLGQLEAIIAKGRLPVLARNGIDSFELISSESKSPYTAITHVWSHGLGNSQDNALPVCQIKNLFNYIEEINPEDPARLWIDSLCIPANGTMKVPAINTLRGIYMNAAAVLLIDGHLQKTSCVDEYERTLQFLSSEWFCRLWTFQEGTLARRLLIRFADGFVDLENLITDARAKFAGLLAKPLDWSDIGNDLQGALISRFSHRAEKNMWLPLDQRCSPNFLQLIQEFRNRTTTVAKDEAICMAALLNIKDPDPTKLPSMELIYQNVDLPEDLLFVSGARLSSPGFRWAPASYLNNENGTGYVDESIGRLSPKGFIVDKPGILLDRSIAFTYWGKGTGWIISPTQPSTKTLSRIKLLQFHLQQDDENGAWQNNGPDQEHLSFLGISPFNTPAQLESRHLPSPGIIFQSCFAILVSDVRQEDGVWRCHYEMAANYYDEPNELAFFGRSMALSLSQFPIPRSISGSLLEKTTWCID